MCHICKRDITCTLTLDEYKDTMSSEVFTDNEAGPLDKCFARETDLLGPKVR